MKYRVTVRGQTREIDVDGGRIVVDGVEFSAELRTIDHTPLRLLLIDRASSLVPIESKGKGVWLVQDFGELHEALVIDERTAHIRSLVGLAGNQPGPGSLKAPMPGLVLRVLVEPGEAVSAGQGLLVLEAMKMENELKAAVAGVVDVVEAVAGQVVEKGALLVRFKAASAT